MRLTGLESDTSETRLAKVISKHYATSQELFPTTPLLEKLRVADDPEVNAQLNRHGRVYRYQ